MGFFTGLAKVSTASISAVFTGTKDIIDELHTSKEEKAILDTAFNKMQVEINKLEAQNVSIFVSGWRPFIGWVCGAGIGFNYVIRPIMNYVIVLLDNGFVQMNPMSMSEIMPLLTGMLGFGALRTFEKHKNKARD